MNLLLVILLSILVNNLYAAYPRVLAHSCPEKAESLESYESSMLHARPIVLTNDQSYEYVLLNHLNSKAIVRPFLYETTRKIFNIYKDNIIFVNNLGIVNEEEILIGEQDNCEYMPLLKISGNNIIADINIWSKMPEDQKAISLFSLLIQLQSRSFMPISMRVLTISLLNGKFEKLSTLEKLNTYKINGLNGFDYNGLIINLKKDINFHTNNIIQSAYLMYRNYIKIQGREYQLMEDQVTFYKNGHVQKAHSEQEIHLSYPRLTFKTKPHTPIEFYSNGRLRLVYLPIGESFETPELRIKTFGTYEKKLEKAPRIYLQMETEKISTIIGIKGKIYLHGQWIRLYSNSIPYLYQNYPSEFVTLEDVLIPTTYNSSVWVTGIIHLDKMGNLELGRLSKNRKQFLIVQGKSRELKPFEYLGFHPLNGSISALPIQNTETFIDENNEVIVVPPTYSAYFDWDEKYIDKFNFKKSQMDIH